MINKVMFEGVVVKSGYGKNGVKGGFFISLRQPKKMSNNYVPKTLYSAYANRPLSESLAKAVSEHPNCHLYIEGRLNTFYKQKNKCYQMTVLIEKFTVMGPNNTQK